MKQSTAQASSDICQPKIPTNPKEEIDDRQAASKKPASVTRA
ncbi:hypothetical protein [Cupriavidus sp. BIS7]|nr:hypothetical protein [Cupriavidus sp. BIS7]